MSCLKDPGPGFHFTNYDLFDDIQLSSCTTGQNSSGLNMLEHLVFCLENKELIGSWFPKVIQGLNLQSSYPGMGKNKESKLLLLGAEPEGDTSHFLQPIE